VADEVTGQAQDQFRITVKNLSTGISLNTLSDRDHPAGGYSVTFVDFTSSSACGIGDVLEITVQTPSPLIGVRPLRHLISTDEVLASQIRLPDLIAYEIPTKTELLPNFPNPFNPETWIPFQLRQSAFVRITIYDTLGREIRRLELGQLPTGYYNTRERAAYWDGRNHSGERVASGLYFYRLEADSFVSIRRMVVLK